jgi:hypothetical protein
MHPIQTSGIIRFIESIRTVVISYQFWSMSRGLFIQGSKVREFIYLLVSHESPRRVEDVRVGHASNGRYDPS